MIIIKSQQEHELKRQKIGVSLLFVIYKCLHRILYNNSHIQTHNFIITDKPIVYIYSKFLNHFSHFNCLYTDIILYMYINTNIFNKKKKKIINLRKQRENKTKKSPLQIKELF